MEKEKRTIIIQEINNWRNSKILPEHYCDFLMNLYKDNESVDPIHENSSWGHNTKVSIIQSHWKLWFLVIIIVTAVLFIVINFNLFPIALQIIISSIIIILCYILGVVKRDNNKITSYLFLGAGSIFLMFIGQYTMNLHQIDDVFWVLGYLVLCSVIWILFGMIFKFGLFQFCGWVGLIFFYSWFLHTKIDQIHWFQIQMLWVPLTVIFIWLGWMLHHRSKRIGNVYFLVGILIWFVPDVYLIIFSELADSLIQIPLLMKIILSGVILFGLRKKWTEWVA